MRSYVLLVPIAAVALSGAVMAVSAPGCAASSSDASGPMPSDDVGVVDGGVDSSVQLVEVGDDSGSPADLCGTPSCDPDVPAVCTPLVTDSGIDDGPADGGSVDAGDAASDAEAGSSISACRVVFRDNAVVSACAPAGKTGESTFCGSDDDCAPGLACVGEPGLGRCLRYCCHAYEDPSSADAGDRSHYCTPQPLAARSTQKVPVWVKLDNCTLLEDELQCSSGTTCTVVTNDGRTTCVPAGTGRDYASCAEEACDRGYVCLGSVDRRCRKLCKEADGTGCPGTSYCQHTSTLPLGYGICTGGDAGP